MGATWGPADEERGFQEVPPGNDDLAVVRPLGTAARDRAQLRARALHAIEHAIDLREEAQRRYRRAEEIARTSAALVAGLDGDHVRELTSRLATYHRDVATARTMALLGGSRRLDLEAACEDRFERIHHVADGDMLIAHAVLDQPDLVVFGPDLDHPGPVEAAAIVRLLAPASSLLVMADDPTVLARASQAGIDSCPSSIRYAELASLVDRLLSDRLSPG